MALSVPGVLRTAAKAVRRSLGDAHRHQPADPLYGPGEVDGRPASRSSGQLRVLSRDDIDLALTYDYNLAPASWRSEHEVIPLWDVEWGIGVPSTAKREPLAAYAGHDWIVNSRHTADEDVLRTLASLNGFTPRVVHRVDALELVDDLIAARLGVALLPRGRPRAAASRSERSANRRSSCAATPCGAAAGIGGHPLRAVLEQLTRGDVGA